MSLNFDPSFPLDLPPVRGRYEFNIPLSQSTWFRVGGPAEVIFKPADIDDLCQFLIQKPSDLPCYPLGAGSNVLVRDAGLQGCVIRLGRSFATIEQQENLVILGAGCLDRTVALTTCQLGLSGLEFLVGIPGATSEHLAEALQKNNIPATRCFIILRNWPPFYKPCYCRAIWFCV